MNNGVGQVAMSRDIRSVTCITALALNELSPMVEAQQFVDRLSEAGAMEDCGVGRWLSQNVLSHEVAHSQSLHQKTGIQRWRPNLHYDDRRRSTTVVSHPGCPAGFDQLFHSTDKPFMTVNRSPIAW
jgi:hypothetical protein